MYQNVIIIAEVKTMSPFGFVSDKSWDELFTIADSVGDILSIHTDQRWGGSFDLSKKAKTLTKKPILAKGIHATDVEIKKAVQAGADFVLVVGRIPGVHQDVCIIEPNTLQELKDIPETYKVVWNSRDLQTGGIKQDDFQKAREIREGWLCQASNIKTKDDIAVGADAILVGTYLETFATSLLK